MNTKGNKMNTAMNTFTMARYQTQAMRFDSMAAAEAVAATLNATNTHRHFWARMAWNDYRQGNWIIFTRPVDACKKDGVVAAL